MRYVKMTSLLVLGILALGASAEDLGTEEFFENRVRPLLASKCLECHGDEEPEADLRLTSREHLLKGGKSGPAATPREPSKSLLIRAINRKGKLKMPPDATLTDEEIRTLSSWVELGMPWPTKAAVTAEASANPAGHWAFQAISNPTPPKVRAENWVREDLDRFVLAKLESAGLSPSPPASRRDWLRRATFDLTGLPPTWEEIENFQRDASPLAFEKVVDRLLGSKRYGERWGRHWLDVARFADTKDGVLMYGDNRIRPYAYTYRDYVIRAFNEDLPFDRFIEEQLAADLIEPKVEPWRLAAMGFLTLGRMYDNNVHDVIDDQIDTVGRGFLGLTISCARCHDHKYDPIPTADYYSLYGVFAGSEAPLEPPLIGDPKASPEAEKFEKEAAVKRETIRKFQEDQYRLLSETARNRVKDYLVHVATTEPDPLETAIFFLSLAPEDLRPPIVARWRRLIERRSAPGDPVFGPWHDLMKISETGDAFEKAARNALDRLKSEPGKSRNPLVIEALAKAKLTSKKDVAAAYGDLLRAAADESKASSPKGGADLAPPADPSKRELWEVVAGRESPSYFPKSQTRRYMSRQQTDEFGGKLNELDSFAVKSPNAPARAMVLNDASTPHEPRIFVRGNPSQPGRGVPRRFLAVLTTGIREPFRQGSGRLELAKAIASPANPLTSRVIVNRIWMHHFGEPLVSTPGDFGKRSNPPAHLELLNHAASRFMKDGWSLKRLHRSIVLSATYRQTSAISGGSAKSESIDPENRLLGRMNRRRLDFESMRDSHLFVSGRLVEKAGGRPTDVAGDPTNRVRTVYGLVDRQSLPGVFRVFDFATPDQSVDRRPRTMVPQQALFALNSPFVIEQAKSFSARPETSSASDPAERIMRMFRVALGREATQEEVDEALLFVTAPADPGSKLGVWEQFAQILLSSNEFMYVD